ncbi:MAG: hypothetical protein M1272_08170 [Firmicutes bacterium]|nr:hypothetical protein [Bacillota bacterium]
MPALILMLFLVGLPSAILGLMVLPIIGPGLYEAGMIPFKIGFKQPGNTSMQG